MYEVVYIPLDDFGGAIGDESTSVSGSTVSVVLIGLQEYVTYTISVRAYTSVGAGPYSGTVDVMTIEDGNANH